jgi:hypothetical protein
MLNFNKFPVEYRIIIGTMFCSIFAFGAGYYLLRQKALLVAAWISIILYVLLLFKYELIDIVKLNICLTGFYFTGCYPYIISKLGLWALKLLMFVGALVSPIYVLNLIPEGTVDFIFSFFLILNSAILIFLSQRPRELMKPHD